MACLAFLCCFLISTTCLAQRDTSVIVRNLLQLEKALVDKDSNLVKSLLHPDVAYGHSSGWVQTKQDVLKDMASGRLVYKKLENQSMSITMNKQYAIVRERLAAEGINGGNSFSLNLFVLHTWVQTKKGWVLLSRQSSRLQQ